MDSQQIKEALAADPFTNDEALIAAVETDSELLQYWQELKQLNDDIIAVSNIVIPENLEAKLLQLGQESMEDDMAAAELDARETNQSMSNSLSNVVQLKSKRRHILHIALAASIAFAVGISFTVLKQSPELQSGTDLAMAHMYHEMEYTQRVSRDVSLDEVNTKLATFGGQMLQSVGKITYANFCFFEKQKSLHLVMHTEYGDVTLFVTPKEMQNKIDNRFDDESYEGRSWQDQEADVTIIGERGKLNAELERTIKRSMQFSA